MFEYISCLTNWDDKKKSVRPPKKITSGCFCWLFSKETNCFPSFQSLDLFKVFFYGLYHDKSPSFTTIWEKMFGSLIPFASTFPANPRKVMIIVPIFSTFNLQSGYLGCSRILFCCLWDSSHLFERRRWRKCFATKKPRLPELMVIVRKVAEGNSSSKMHETFGLRKYGKLPRRMPFQEDTIQEQGILSKFWLKRIEAFAVLFFKQKKETSLVPNTCRIKMTYMGSRDFSKAPSPKKTDMFLYCCSCDSLPLGGQMLLTFHWSMRGVLENIEKNPCSVWWNFGRNICLLLLPLGSL